MPLAAIRNEDLGKLIAAVRRGGRFYGPIDTGDGVCLAEAQPTDKLTLDYANFTTPPKRMFFPRREVIATHGPGGMVEAPLPETKVVLFGLRPCDAKALRYLDKVFVDERYADPYYLRRRQNAVVIVLACREPAGTCFCTSLGGGPGATDGADVLAAAVDGALVLESVTPAGEAFLAEHAALLAKPMAAQVKARDAQIAAAAEKIGPVATADVTARLQRSSEGAAWDVLSERCLGCGVCTYLCPTCHCFGLYDEQVGGQCRRVRAQDACAFPTFTLEASGHNPRTRQGLRMRQRVMHKFRYTAENFGDIFCVGCGRCIASCPANMDIRETVSEVPQ